MLMEHALKDAKARIGIVRKERVFKNHVKVNALRMLHPMVKAVAAPSENLLIGPVA